MAEPEWLELEAVLTLHERSLALHGGAPGEHDRGLLESALQRPKNRFHYDGVEDVFDLAATYCAGISSNHPFIDGNKRAAFAALVLFLLVNGYLLEVGWEEATAAIYTLAAGEMDIPTLAAWARKNVVPFIPPAP
ncbi:MAG: type II toxin-antitoxin system death-on-curing family toxin [Pseudomonadota bacterium]|jgi:death-on-curing protein